MENAAKTLQDEPCGLDNGDASHVVPYTACSWSDHRTVSAGTDHSWGLDPAGAISSSSHVAWATESMPHPQQSQTSCEAPLEETS